MASQLVWIPGTVCDKTSDDINMSSMMSHHDSTVILSAQNVLRSLQPGVLCIIRTWMQQSDQMMKHQKQTQSPGRSCSKDLLRCSKCKVAYEDACWTRIQRQNHRARRTIHGLLSLRFCAGLRSLYSLAAKRNCAAAACFDFNVSPLVPIC